MNKIIEGAKEAVEIAKCDHNLIIQPELSPTLDKYWCPKCHGTFYQKRREMTNGRR